jgi:hypothetical protein
MIPSELCALDPVNVSIHFHKKWNAIFNGLLRSKDNPPLGVVQDFFWRIEYQSRGTEAQKGHDDSLTFFFLFKQLLQVVQTSLKSGFNKKNLV